jgi:excisionase family DNA binding protein
MDSIAFQEEQEVVERVKKLLKELGPFVSLAEASRMTGVPLATLSEAVREGRIPAVQVQSRRWLVRVSAVLKHFGLEEPPDLEFQKQLLAEGLLSEIKYSYRFDHFEPMPIEGRPLSEILIEERR